MTNAQRTLLIVLTAALLAVVVLAPSLMFTVDERQLAVVLRFGKPVEAYTKPGLKFKMPFVDQVLRLPKSYQFWTGAPARPGATGEILEDVTTTDAKKIEVTPWAIWRINDDPEGVKKFAEVLRTVEIAESRVKQFVRSEVRDTIQSYELAEVVRSTDRELTYTFQAQQPGLSGGGADRPGGGPSQSPDPDTARTTPPVAATEEAIEAGREKIVQQIREAIQTRMAKTQEGDQIDRGIELVDVGIAKIDFVDQVRDAAFQRLIAFMESIAQENEAEGEREKTKILNEANAKVQQIEGEGKGEANRIRGEVEAQIIQMYADAIKQTGDFYDFVRTLEAYKEAVGGNTRLILTTDSEMFRLLKSVPPVGPLPPDAGRAEEPSAETENPKTAPETPAPAETSSQ